MMKFLRSNCIIIVSLCIVLLVWLYSERHYLECVVAVRGRQISVGSYRGMFVCYVSNREIRENLLITQTPISQIAVLDFHPKGGFLLNIEDGYAKFGIHLVYMFFIATLLTLLRRHPRRTGFPVENASDRPSV